MKTMAESRSKYTLKDVQKNAIHGTRKFLVKISKDIVTESLCVHNVEEECDTKNTTTYHLNLYQDSFLFTS